MRQVTEALQGRLSYVPAGCRCLQDRKFNMYTLKSKVIATSVIAFTLLAAAPVFADSNSGNGDSGLHLGAFAKIFSDRDDRDDRKEDRKEAQEDRKEDRKDARKNHATSTTATTTKQVSIEGTITFVSGSTITVQGTKGAVYTVNAATATIKGHNDVTLSLSALAVNDKVHVKGTLTNNVIVATKIKDKSDQTGKTFRAFSAGIVTAINGAAVSLSNFGSNGSTTVTTNTATAYRVNGSTASSGALTVGSHVLVLGTSSATSTTSFNASIIVILTEGLNWIKHFWR